MEGKFSTLAKRMTQSIQSKKSKFKYKAVGKPANHVLMGTEWTICSKGRGRADRPYGGTIQEAALIKHLNMFKSQSSAATGHAKVGNRQSPQ